MNDYFALFLISVFCAALCLLLALLFEAVGAVRASLYLYLAAVLSIPIGIIVGLVWLIL